MSTSTTHDGMTNQQLVTLEEGTLVRVTYESPHGERGNEQSFEARVAGTEHNVITEGEEDFHFGMLHLERDPEDLSRRRVRLQPREGRTVQYRRTTMQGAVWSRLSTGSGNVTVTLVEETTDEDEDTADTSEGETMETDNTETETDEEESAFDRMKARVEGGPEFTREEAGVPEESTRVAVEYKSTHAKRLKTMVGTVERAEVAPGAIKGRLWHVYITPEGERNDRKEHYREEEDTTPRRRLVIAPELESVTLESRNGGRWHRLSRGDAEVRAVETEEDEATQGGEGVTVVVEVRHTRCAGTSVLAVTETEPEVMSKGLACPHCHPVDRDSCGTIEEEYEVTEVMPITCHPEDVDTSMSLHRLKRRYGVAEWAASPKRWRAFREAVIKGRKSTEVAEAFGVSPGTIYRHVHDAREVIKEVSAHE